MVQGMAEFNCEHCPSLLSILEPVPPFPHYFTIVRASDTQGDKKNTNQKTAKSIVTI